MNNTSSAIRALELLASGGIGAALIGLLGKLWVDRKLERERARYGEELARLEAELAKKHTIHKLQFEKEFSIYLDLWKALVKLKDACASLMPISEFVGENETKWKQTHSLRPMSMWYAW